MRTRIERQRDHVRSKWAGPATGKDIFAAVVVLIAATLSLLLGFGWYIDGQFDEERRDRFADRAEDREKVDSIAVRVGRLEFACERERSCARTLRQQRRRAPGAPTDRRRRDRRDSTERFEPRGDRPPRTPATPPPIPDPVEGTPPPDVPSLAPDPTAPGQQNPPRQPRVVDVPPLDLDGPDGPLPRVAPEVNVPPVDLPPVQLPDLTRRPGLQ